MNHHSYDEWLLSEETLLPEQESALNAHLASCNECQSLQSSWQSVEGMLRTCTLQAPESGFTTRWMVRLAQRRQRASRLTAWTVFGICVLATGVVTALLLAGGGWEWPSISGTLLDLTKELIALTGTFYALRNFISALVSAVTEGWCLAWWVPALIAPLGLIALWLGTIYHFALRGAAKGVLR